MPLTEKSCVTLTCDRCDKTFNDEYVIHFDDAADARKQVTDYGDDYGWRIIDDRWLCNEHWTYADDEDFEYVEVPLDDPAPAPLPDYITLDPEQGSCADRHGAHWHCPAHRHTGTWIGQDDNVACARAEAVKHLNELHPGWDAPAAPQGVDAPEEITP